MQTKDGLTVSLNRLNGQYIIHVLCVLFFFIFLKKLHLMKKYLYTINWTDWSIEKLTCSDNNNA